ncbi:MAG: biotin--[acetyl-CoA-carboxylase] ligase [Bacteroidota bacterium]
MYKILAKTLFTGKRIIYMPSCHSTNDMASELAEKSDTADGTIVITSDQTKGKGQRGNSWESEPDQNFTFSIIFKPTFLSVTDQFYLNVITSLGIADFLIELGLHAVKVKWPNDIYFGDSKLCGILISNSLKSRYIDKSIVGIGLNVNQKHFDTPKAASISTITGRQYVLTDLFEVLVQKVEQRYIQLRGNQFNKLKTDYTDRLYWKGEMRTFKDDKGLFRGEISGFDKQGRLMVEAPDGTRSFGFKEIQYIE